MSNCHHGRTQALEGAYRAAQELLKRREAEEDLPREEPMKRYIHPVPCCCPPWPAGGCTADLDGVLEALARQNQLLLDILGAVNALSAAVLSIQSRM